MSIAMIHGSQAFVFKWIAAYFLVYVSIFRIFMR